MEIVTKYLNERVDSGAVTQQTADKERPELDNMLASLRQWPPVKSDITAWVKAQVDRGNAPSTIGTRLAIANGFFEWCVGERLIEVNPTRGVSRPRVPPKYNRSLTPEEIDKLYEVVRGKSKRARAMFWLMYGEGLRCVEGARLRWHDVDSHHRQEIHVRGKGYRDERSRVVPMSERTRSALLAHAVTSPPDDRYVFTHKGNPTTAKRISENFSGYFREAGVKGSAHALRHTCAEELARVGDARQVQDFLGHQNVATTGEYLRAAQDLSELQKERFGA